MLVNILINNEFLAKNKRFKKFIKNACIQTASEAQTKKKLTSAKMLRHLICSAYRSLLELA